MAKRPDAWMTLVLSTMSVEELKRELATATGDERRWLLAELQRREQLKAQ